MRCGAEFRRHYIETEIDQRHDGGIALADAGGFHDDQIETCYLACGDYIGQRQRNFRAGFASREGAHENAFLPAPRADCVHADAVTEKRTARFASRGIDRNHGDLERVALIEANAANEFVGQRRLACAARSGDAQRRSRDCFCGLMQGVFEPWSSLAVLQRGDQLRQRAMARASLAVRQCVQRGGSVLREIDVASLNHRQDHAGQAHALAVFGAEDFGDAVGLQFSNLGGNDDAAAASEYLDARAAAFFQQVNHVFEVFDMPALIAGHGDGMRVLLQSSGHDFVNRAVVAEVNDFSAVGHQNAAHDVDGGVVTVEERGRGDKANFVGRFVFGGLLGWLLGNG